MSAVDAFHHAMADLLDRGIRPPCSTATDDQNDWLADDLESQARASLKCLHCPLRALCFDMATETKTSFGVFGAHVFTKFPKPRKQAS